MMAASVPIYPAENKYPPTHPQSNAERLILAMAPIDAVISEFGESCEEQDRFAMLMARHWEDVSETFARNVTKKYVSCLDNRHQTAVESDQLMELLMMKVNLKRQPNPKPTDSCFLSFDVSPSQHGTAPQFYDEKLHAATDISTNNAPLLRLRVYPYHNDVALRLWEAGACLAEFLMEHAEYVRDRKVVELGAGVGLTGLIAAGVCQAESVFMTDYTSACLQNMEYNIAQNQNWLEYHRQKACQANKESDAPTVCEGYLEWNAFAEDNDQPVVLDNLKEQEDPSALQTFQEFFASQVLLAADVIYDVSVIESLVLVMRSFLRFSDCSSPEQGRMAVFAITKRNMSTFQIFLNHLEQYDIACKWLARGQDCECLPRVFPCNFVQPRKDVCIVLLTAKDDQT